MTYSGSIYFLGAYRPAYFEARTISDLASMMRRAIREMDAKSFDWFEARIDQCVDDMLKGYACVSIDHCNKGVGMDKRPHDPWLDDMTRDMPRCPDLDYSVSIHA